MKLLNAALAAVLALSCGAVQAQAGWPAKPITLIVPFPPGGGTDAFARPLSAHLSKELGRQVIIDNRGGAGGTVGAAIAAKAASLLVEARGTDINYQLPSSTLSGRETRLYAGVTWDATAATYGTIKVGQLRKSHDSPRPTYTEPSWEGMITWMPRTYSKFDVYSSRQPVESTGQGDFILSDATGAIWSHGWTSVISTDINAGFVKDRYQGFERTDETQSYGIRANYKMRRWLTLGAEYQYTKRDSTQDFNDYDKNLWLISAILSM